ncbi:MAG: hypothetical protein VKI83_00240 [Synechococcaceae cyanobacterium]|nr:hypothetical protein [Synechococcaceae cyanobacterium]
MSTPSRSPLHVILALSVLGGLGLGLVALVPAVCRPLGLCLPSTSSRGDSATAQALARAQLAASALDKASALKPFQAALADLDRELLRLSGDALTSEQARQHRQLQDSARDGHKRLRLERQEAQAVSQAGRRIDALPSLAAERQDSERSTIRRSLSGIPTRSFSSTAAQQQLSRLSATPAPVPPPAPPADASAPAAEPAAPPVDSAPASPAAPRWRPDPAPSGSGGQESWSSPGRQPSAGSQGGDDGNSNAPYRDDPLF